VTRRVPGPQSVAERLWKASVEARREEELRRTTKALKIFFLYGVAALAVVSLASVFAAPSIGAAVQGFFLTLGGSFLLAAAAGTLGGLLGFLFGVPPALQGNDGETRTANTNLEQISDWLTKILVGVSLTQLTEAPTYLWTYAGKLSPLFGTQSYAQPIALVIMISAAVLGFFAGYLLTRLFLSVALTRADHEAHRVILQAQENVLASLDSPPEASEEMEAQREALLEQVEGLPAAAARNLLEKIATAFDSRIGALVSAQYPEAVRAADADAARAKIVLARAVVLTVSSAEAAETWQSALREVA